MSKTSETFQGIGAGPGFAVGHAFLLSLRARSVPSRAIADSQIDREIARLDAAVGTSLAGIDSLLRRIEERGTEGAAILKAHRLILLDEMLIESTRTLIRADLLNAEAALERTLVSLETAFSNLRDEYFKERSTDLRFVVSDVMANLSGDLAGSVRHIPAGAVLVAHELSPTQTLELTARRLAGFVTEVGGKASHTAIMARAMEIPAVVGAAGILSRVVNGQWIAIDGVSGQVILHPDKQTIDRFRDERRRYRERETELLANRDILATTRDGQRVELYGNIEYLAEIESLVAHGGEGIGLYRTEYLFFRDSELPDEETQYDEYRQIVEEIAPLPATLRTLDVGADKMGDAIESGDDENPALGLRGIRLALRQRQLLRTQLRALLRASAHGKLRLLIPFVTGPSDLRAVQAVIEEATTELRAEGHAVTDHIPIGVMIEIPSAALVAGQLAREADFFSLGTNDLVQYTLAVDRNNEAVANLYRPLHPAVLQLIVRTAEAGRRAGIEVSICGEIAGEPHVAPMLVGCGLTAFSMNPISIPHVKEVIALCDTDDCRRLVDDLLELPTAADVEARLREYHAALVS